VSANPVSPPLLAQVRRADRRASRGVPPWTSDELTWWVAAQVLASLLVFVAWYQSAGELTARNELAWLNLGIVGLVIAGATNGLLLLRGRRRIGFARIFVLSRVPAPGSRPARIPSPSSLGHLAVGSLVSGAGMTRYHRPDCLLVADKVVEPVSLATRTECSLQPCELCEP
jgi:hypothetical protein